MFTRAAGPACVNGCVRDEPHAGHSMRAGRPGGVAAGCASSTVVSFDVASSSSVPADPSRPSASIAIREADRFDRCGYFLVHAADDEAFAPALFSFFA